MTKAKEPIGKTDTPKKKLAVKKQGIKDLEVKPGKGGAVKGGDGPHTWTVCMCTPGAKGT